MTKSKVQLESHIDNIKSNKVFNYELYVKQVECYVLENDIDLIRHFCEIGWTEGLNPCSWFDTNYYLNKYPDVKSSQVNPFIHYLIKGIEENRLPHPHISLNFIEAIQLSISKNIQKFDALNKHIFFIKNNQLYNSTKSLTQQEKIFWEYVGNSQNSRMMHIYFDDEWYSRIYGIPQESAWSHFIELGKWLYLTPCESLFPFMQKVREIFKGDWFTQLMALPHRLDIVDFLSLSDIQKSYEIYSTGLFDETWYVRQYDIDDSSTHSLIHFCKNGVFEGKNPNNMFDQNWYFKKYQLTEKQLAIIHYIRNWHTLKFNPSELFSIKDYVSSHPVLLEKNIEPLYYLLKDNSKDSSINEIKKSVKKNIVTIEEHIDCYFDYCLKLSDNKLIIVGWELKPIDLNVATLSFNNISLNQNVIFKSNFYRKDVNTLYQKDDTYNLGTITIIEIETSASILDMSTNIQIKLTANSEYACPFFKEKHAYLEVFKFVAKHNDATVNKDFLTICLADMLPIIDEVASKANSYEDFFRINVDSATLIPKLGILVKGWAIDTMDYINSIYVVQDNLLSSDLYDNAEWFRRADVFEAHPDLISDSFKAGMLGLFKNSAFTGGQPFKFIIVTNYGDIIVRPIKVSTSIKAPSQYMQEALQHLNVNNELHLSSLQGFVGEVIDSVWTNKSVEGAFDSIKHYGHPVKNPKCSIIIPIYGRSDFIFYQLAQMSQDPFMKEVEIIYVLDDPRIIDQFEKYSSESYELFQLPFKTVQYGRNLGYAGANNMGCKAAESNQLLLLNSDVMPKDIGWLKQMLDIYGQEKDIGILGARLLFEDNTIQHDGLEYFKSPQYPSFWLIDHPGKGLPISLAEPASLKQIDSVTGACLMISKDLYQEVGGLDESYAYGDFEDSDLCLTVLSLGFKNYIDRRISLYHLERQSQNLFDDISWKFKLTIFNALKHTYRWDSTISKITKSIGN